MWEHICALENILINIKVLHITEDLKVLSNPPV